jgi:hypothetical protein
MYVTGLLLCYVGAEVMNSQVSHIVLFVKEKDLILTSDYWKRFVNYDLIFSLRLIMCSCTMK